jgi:hypothetical protein
MRMESADPIEPV